MQITSATASAARLIFTRIVLGLHTTVDEYREALAKADCRMTDWANDILGSSQMTFASEATEFDLLRVSVNELGLKDGAHYKDIYNCAANVGLERCSAEVGPALRLVYRNQPQGEWLRIAMEGIIDSRGRCGVFVLYRGSSLSLYGSGAGPGDLCSADDRFVFVRPRA